MKKEKLYCVDCVSCISIQKKKTTQHFFFFFGFFLTICPLGIRLSGMIIYSLLVLYFIYLFFKKSEIKEK